MENKIPAENANDGIGQDEKEEDNADEIPQNDLEDLLPEDVSLVPEDGTASSSLPAQQQPSVIGRNLLKQKTYAPDTDWSYPDEAPNPAVQSEA